MGDHKKTSCDECQFLNDLKRGGNGVTVIQENKDLFIRNENYLKRLTDYDCSYTVKTRYLFGDWLVSPELLSDPLLPVGVIEIECENDIIDMAESGDLLILLTKSLSLAVSSFYLTLPKKYSAAKISIDRLILLDLSGFTIPKYHITMSPDQYVESRKRELRILGLMSHHKKLLKDFFGEHEEISSRNWFNGESSNSQK